MKQDKHVEACHFSFYSVFREENLKSLLLIKTFYENLKNSFFFMTDFLEKRMFG